MEDGGDDGDDITDLGQRVDEPPEEAPGRGVQGEGVVRPGRQPHPQRLAGQGRTWTVSVIDRSFQEVGCF